MRVLVSGANGFIGGRLVEYLRALGREVIAVDKDGNHGSIQGSLLDIDTWMQLPQVDQIYHLAATIQTRQLTDNKAEVVIRENSRMMNLMLGWAWSLPHFPKIVFTSTHEVYYGGEYQMPTTEKSPTTIANPLDDRWSYAYAKQLCEERLEDQGTIVRFCNVYGPNMKQSYVVKSLIQRILGGENPLVVNNPQDTRQMLYVDDAVRGLICLMENDTEGVYNIAGGTNHKIIDIAQKLVDIAVPDIEVVGLTQDTYEDRLSDASRIRALGWEPIVDLEEGLMRTYDSYNIAD